MGGRKNEGAKKSSKTIDIVSYALEVSVHGVTCVFVVHFRSSGNNLVLHKSLLTTVFNDSISQT